MSRETRQALTDMEPEFRHLFIARVEEALSSEMAKANTTKFLAEHSVPYVEGLAAQSTKKKERADFERAILESLDIDALMRGEAIDVDAVAIASAVKAKSATSALVTKKNNNI